MLPFHFALYTPLSIYLDNLVTEMLKEVTDSLTYNHEHARKELDDVIGGRVLKFKNEDIIIEATDEKEFQDIQKLIKNKGWTTEKAIDELNVSAEKRKLYAEKLTNRKHMATI